jgi:hypothetical protein
VDANDFNDRKFHRKHTIIDQRNSGTGFPVYIIEREETNYSVDGGLTKSYCELQLSLSELLSDEDGFQLLQDWNWKSKMPLKSGHFIYTHKIIEQTDSPTGNLYQVERKIEHFDSEWTQSKQATESFLVPVDIMSCCEAAGILLNQWDSHE